MIIVRTLRAIEGFREVASYIAAQFGNKALIDFQKRTKEWSRLLKKCLIWVALMKKSQLNHLNIGLFLFIGVV